MPMLYDFRTYTCKPGGGAAEFVKRFNEHYEVRAAYSKLGALFTTEVGPLNQVIHIWPYKDPVHMDQVRQESAKDTSGRWPPKGDDVLVNMETELVMSAPFMEEWTGEPRHLGNVYELRTYTFVPGVMGEVMKRWAEAVPVRKKYSPVVGVWASAGFGNTMNKLYHMWAYQDMNERGRIRAEALKDPSGKWPPQTTQWILHQETKLLNPVGVSPLH